MENKTTTDNNTDVSSPADMADRAMKIIQNRKVSKLLQGSEPYLPSGRVPVLNSDSARLNNACLDELLRCDFIHKYQNIWLLGSPGIGKTYTSSVIANHARRLHYSVRYFQPYDFFRRCEDAEKSNVYQLFLETLCKTNLIILDDFLMTGIGVRQASYLFSFLKYPRDPENPRIVLICSQLKEEDIKQRLLEESPELGEDIMNELMTERIVLTIKGNDLKRTRQRNRT